MFLWVLKEQLASLDQTYEESLRLLRETNAAVEIRKFNNAIMDFSSIDVFMVCVSFFEFLVLYCYLRLLVVLLLLL